jgi:hypothetical protein
MSPFPVKSKQTVRGKALNEAYDESASQNAEELGQFDGDASSLNFTYVSEINED